MKPLKIAVLTTAPESKSTERFATAIEDRGHEPVIIDPSDCWVKITDSGQNHLFYRPADSDKSSRIAGSKFDAVIPRLGKISYGLNILRYFTNMRIFATVQDFSVLAAADKWHTAMIASRIGVKVPKQILSVNPVDHTELMNHIDKKPPIFAKMVRGSLGRGCFVLPDSVNGRMFLQSMEAAQQPIILQRHMSKDTEERRTDHRIWCIGAESDNPKFSAMKRIATSDDPRTNWSINKKAEPYEPDPLEKQMCVDIARAVGGGVLGIDTMADHETTTFRLIEINANPGTDICDIVPPERNPVRLTVDYVVQQCTRKNPNRVFWTNIAETMQQDFTPAKNFMEDSKFTGKYRNIFNLLKTQ